VPGARSYLQVLLARRAFRSAINPKGRRGGSLSPPRAPGDAIAVGPPPAGPGRSTGALSGPADGSHDRRAAAPAGEAEGCGHPFRIEGICTTCGDLAEDPPGGAEAGEVHRLSHVAEGLVASGAEADRIRAEKNAETLRRGKLNLVLDLDHTLLNSTGDSRLALSIPERALLFQALRVSARAPRPGPVRSGPVRSGPVQSGDRRPLPSRPQAEEEASGGDERRRTLFHFPSASSEGMWTKLRPGVREFLARAQELFHVSINTLGSREYAHSMARKLDPPAGACFQQVLGKQDGRQERDPRTGRVRDTSKSLSNNLDLDERTTLVLDDSPERWRHCSGLVLPIHRYHFFPSSCRDFGQDAGACHLLRGDDEDAARGPLARAMAAMEAIHGEFFRQEAAGGRPSTRAVIARHRGRALAGEVVCFTGVIPFNPATGQREPARNRDWNLALSVGARCQLELDDQVTVVVAAARGTDKVLQAERRGIPCVGLGWLRASALHGAREDPVLHPPPEPARRNR